MSGGERQRFTAFIMAAALSYQLGIAEQGFTTYGTVMMDEAFVLASEEFAGAGHQGAARVRFPAAPGRPGKRHRPVPAPGLGDGDPAGQAHQPFRRADRSRDRPAARRGRQPGAPRRTRWTSSCARRAEAWRRYKRCHLLRNWAIYLPSRRSVGQFRPPCAANLGHRGPTRAPQHPHGTVRGARAFRHCRTPALCPHWPSSLRRTRTADGPCPSGAALGGLEASFRWDCSGRPAPDNRAAAFSRRAGHESMTVPVQASSMAAGRV